MSEAEYFSFCSLAKLDFIGELFRSQVAAFQQLRDGVSAKVCDWFPGEIVLDLLVDRLFFFWKNEAFFVCCFELQNAAQMGQTVEGILSLTFYLIDPSLLALRRLSLSFVFHHATPFLFPSLCRRNLRTILYWK